MLRAELSWPLDTFDDAQKGAFTDHLKAAFDGMPTSMCVVFGVRDATPLPDLEVSPLDFEQRLQQIFQPRRRLFVLQIEDHGQSTIDTAVERITAMCGTIGLPAPERAAD